MIQPRCSCEIEERRIMIDCTVYGAYPRPERHSAQFKDLYKHWTICPNHLEERQIKGLIVNSLTCCMCHKVVIR